MLSSQLVHNPPDGRTAVSPLSLSAFDAVLAEETDRLFGLAYSILRDRQEAEDAVQETMVLAWKSWDTLRDTSQRSAWLRTICLRRCLRLRRRLIARRQSREELSDSHATVNADHDLATVDTRYQKLSRQQRAVVVLHYHYGYSLDECADLLKSRPGTVRSHLNRALEKLRLEITHV